MLCLSSITFLMSPSSSFFFFFNDTPTTEIYTLSLHDALPISRAERLIATIAPSKISISANYSGRDIVVFGAIAGRSEEHTSELQSQFHLVCRLLLEKKKK